MLAISLYGRIVDLKLRRYFLGESFEGTQSEVGFLALAKGDVKRQLVSESEFKYSPTQAVLYTRDTLVTGADSGATVELKDGSTIELGPNTMIQLTFTEGFSLAGINRKSLVNVISGEVTGQAKAKNIILKAQNKRVDVVGPVKQTLRVAPEPPKAIAIAPPSPTPVPLPPPPSPSPEPVPVPSPLPPPPPKKEPERQEVELINPKPGEKLKVDPASKELELPIDFVWSAKPSLPKMRLRVKRGTTSALEKVVEMKDGKGSFSWSAKNPGAFSWEILGADGTPLKITKGKAKSEFSIDPIVPSIQVQDPLVAGKVIKSNELQVDEIRDFSVTLRWKPDPRAVEYKLWFGAKPDSPKALFEKTVSKAEFLFNKNQVFQGSVFYRVMAPLKSGFILTTGTQKFRFDFVPPILVVPADKATQSLGGSGDSAVLFTWQKTNFTEKYDFQLATDAEFKNIIQKKTLKENFFVGDLPKAGLYYWRVQAFSKKISSGFGKPNELNVTP